MKFKVKNLGFIDHGEIDLNNFTVICGDNNVGKTYLNYSIYGFLKLIYSLAEFKTDDKYINQIYERGFCSIELKDYESQIKTVLENVSGVYSKKLDFVFSSNSEFFKKSKFSYVSDNPYENIYFKKFSLNLSSAGQKEVLKLFKEENSNILEVSLLEEERKIFPKNLLENTINQALTKIFFQNEFKSPFIITSERTGISLFYKELDINKNIIIEQLSKTNGNDINPFSIISEMVSRYPISIKDNIDYIRDIDQLLTKNKSFLIENMENRTLLKNWENLLGGSFKILNKEIYFLPKKERQREKISPMPMYMTSSSSKSLLALDLYIKSIAQQNQLLIIDEPELNLHPGKQVYMARLLAQLSNMGIKILITTHSDFLVKELNNLIMLSNDFKKEEIMKKYGYDNSEVLNPKSINFYIASKNHTLTSVPVTNTGVDLQSFNEVIMNINERSDEIFYSLE